MEKERIYDHYQNVDEIFFTGDIVSSPMLRQETFLPSIFCLFVGLYVFEKSPSVIG